MEAEQQQETQTGSESSPQKTEKKEIALLRGVVAPRSVEEQYRVAKLYLASRMLPERFNTVESVLTALHFAAEHFPGSPLTALRQIAVVKGTPTFFGDLPLAKVMQTGLLIGKEEYFLDEDGQKICVENGNLKDEPWAAVCITTRKAPGPALRCETVFTLADAKRAGLLSNPCWKTYPQDMLKYRARGRNLKDNFPDALNGIAQGEFDHGTTIDQLPAERVSATLADELNQEFLPEAPKALESGDGNA